MNLAFCDYSYYASVNECRFSVFIAKLGSKQLRARAIFHALFVELSSVADEGIARIQSPRAASCVH